LIVVEGIQSDSGWDCILVVENLKYSLNGIYSYGNSDDVGSHGLN